MNKRYKLALIISLSTLLLTGIGTSIWYFFLREKDEKTKESAFDDYFEDDGEASALDFSEMAYGEMDSMEKVILDKDIDKIKDYVDEKDLGKFKKNKHGVFIRIEKEGNGKFAERGDEVIMHSNGFTIEGKKFFSTYDYKQPLSFKAFTGQMIPGFDEAIEKFDEGSEGTVIVPSPLAYSDQVIKGIPKYSVMRFDIKIVKIKKAPVAKTKKSTMDYGIKPVEKEKAKSKGVNAPIK